MTTLELAEKVVEAVCDEAGMRVYPRHRQVLTIVVLRTLHDNSSWFCRVSDPEDGLTVDTPYEQVQLELYR